MLSIHDPWQRAHHARAPQELGDCTALGDRLDKKLGTVEVIYQHDERSLYLSAIITAQHARIRQRICIHLTHDQILEPQLCAARHHCASQICVLCLMVVSFEGTDTHGPRYIPDILTRKLQGIYYFCAHPFLWPLLRARLLPCALLSLFVLTNLFLWTYLPQVLVKP